jgi:SAM-dependent methyltransferase
MFRCAICDGLEARPLLQIDSPDRFEVSIGVPGQGYSRQWVECQQCGTAFNVLPPESAQRLAALRAAYYEVDFVGSDIGEKYQRVMTMPSGQSDNAGRVARVVSFAHRWFGELNQPRVMDIGAGTGVFLSRLVNETAGAWQYLGVEPDPRAAAHLRQLDRFPVVESMYLGQPELQGFNLVTLNKVLEHIEQPLQFLQQVAGSLVADDGLLYIEVPDKVTTRLRPPQDNILGPLHCHLYDPMSLAHLVRRAGLELLRIDRIAEPSGKLSVYAFAAPMESVVSKGLPRE